MSSKQNLLVTNYLESILSLPSLCVVPHNTKFGVFSPINWISRKKAIKDVLILKRRKKVTIYVGLQQKSAFENFKQLPPDDLLLDSATNLGPLISLWELDKFKNYWNKSFRTSKILTLLYQQFSNLLISQRYMSGPRLGALSNNRWSEGIETVYRISYCTFMLDGLFTFGVIIQILRKTKLNTWSDCIEPVSGVWTGIVNCRRIHCLKRVRYMATCVDLTNAVSAALLASLSRG